MNNSIDDILNAGSALFNIQKEAERINMMVQPHSVALKAYEAITQNYREMERLAKLAYPQYEMAGVNHIAKRIEAQTRNVRGITGTLRIRETMRVSNELSRVFDEERLRLHKSIDSSLGKTLAAINTQTSSAQASLMSLAKASNALFDGLGTAHLKRIEELAKPFQFNHTPMQTSLTEALKRTQHQLNIAECFRFPLLDPISSATIAQIWGTDTFHERINSITTEVERALQDADSEISGKSDTGISITRPRVPSIDFWTLFNILLAIAFLMYQKWDSDQMEMRISGQIRDENAALQKQIKHLENLLIQAMSTKQPLELGDTQFVVRSRIARIQKAPQSGATVVAEVFPNQVVTLLNERGKWIEVEYYD